MNKQALRPVRLAVFALIALLTATVFVPVASAKIKDGVYYDPGTAKHPAFGYVQTVNFKVIGAGFNVKFKDKKGKACTPDGLLATDGYVNVAFETKATKPKSSGKFTVKNKKSASFPGLKATVSGKFKSANKATFKATLKLGGCTAKGNFTKALYSAGG